MVFEIRLLSLNLPVFTYVTLNKFLNLSVWVSLSLKRGQLLSSLDIVQFKIVDVQIKIVDVCEAFNIVSDPMIRAH